MYRKFLRVVPGEVGSNAQDYDDCVCKGIPYEGRYTRRLYLRRQNRYRYPGKVKHRSISFHIELLEVLNNLLSVNYLVILFIILYVFYLCFISNYTAELLLDVNKLN